MATDAVIERLGLIVFEELPRFDLKSLCDAGDIVQRNVALGTLYRAQISAINSALVRESLLAQARVRPKPAHILCQYVAKRSFVRPFHGRELCGLTILRRPLLSYIVRQQKLSSVGLNQPDDGERAMRGAVLLLVINGEGVFPVNLAVAIGALVFTVAFMGAPKFRRVILQVIGAGLCFGVAYYLIGTDRPFEQFSNKLHALHLRLEGTRSQLEAKLAAAEARREASETLDADSRQINWAKPIYTRDRAIICPLSIFDDPRADHDIPAIHDLWTSVWSRSAKVKALGCEEWRDGVAVRARLAFPDQKSSIVIINEILFTQQFDLRN